MATQLEKIQPLLALESELLKLPQVDMPIEHQFCNGLYARTMRIPAGTVATGAIHREESFFLVRSGDLILSTGEESNQLGAGDMCISTPGMKRAVVTLTDVVLTTFHPNPSNETDPDNLWHMYTMPVLLECVQ